MSYDFSMKKMVTQEVEIEELNYTYNISPMFRLALGENGIHELEDVSHDVALDLLDIAIRDMEENPEDYKALNPTNGWGDAEGAKMCLVTIREWFRKHPDCTFVIE